MAVDACAQVSHCLGSLGNLFMYPSTHPEPQSVLVLSGYTV